MNKSWLRFTGGVSCFYCGVDSKQLIALFLLTLGCGILGSVCMLLWSISKGDFKDIEGVKMKVLESEGISHKEVSHEGK